MSTLLSNRSQSPFAGSIRRSITDFTYSNKKQRSITSATTQRSNTDIFNQSSWRARKNVTISDSINRGQNRPKTAVGNKIETKLYPNEIEKLVRSLDRDEKNIVSVDCLSQYRRLVEAIDLRYAPLDSKSLLALQKRENRIIQRNACQDTRFRSLMQVLHQPFIIGDGRNVSHKIHNNNPIDYSSADGLHI